jgi:hypothetical protein
MSKQILKNLLKPPFYIGCSGCIHDSNTRLVAFPEYVSEGKIIQAKFNEFVLQALNEKWERDFGEPMRWIYHEPKHVSQIGSLYECPKCHNLQVKESNYCPRCGQKLYPPEGKEAAE